MKKVLTKSQLDKLAEHKKKGSHTTKHINDMKKAMLDGKTFSQAHKLAMLPKTYIPKTLSKEDKKKQEKSILEKKERPKLESFKSKKSGWVEKFEKKYNKKITDKSWINKNIIKSKGQDEIMSKGKGAFYSSGSRPNQTSFSWAYGRLASVIMNGKARNIDKKIWEKYKIIKKN